MSLNLISAEKTTDSEKLSALEITQPEKLSGSERFHFVDGIRALCVLFVVEHHIYFELFANNALWAQMAPTAQFLSAWMRHGYIAVAAFIVVSGFCLMLPVVASNSDSLAGGIKGFLLRRVRRILPPYYAALALSLLLIAAVPRLNEKAGFHWDWSLPALTKGSIISHLFLVHNLNSTWMTKINHPLWSIAIEWQIYFVFALLLMPIRRKFGIVAAITTGCILSAVPGIVFHTGDNIRPWYLGLFCLGMLAATIALSRHQVAVALRHRVPWSWITLLLAIAESYFAVAKFDQTINEIVTAVVITCALIWGASFDKERATRVGKVAMACLTAPVLVSIGVFSYSIYLIHAPIIAILRIGLVSLSLPPMLLYGLLLALGTILSVAGGYGFFCLIERRFMTKQKKIAQSIDFSKMSRGTKSL